MAKKIKPNSAPPETMWRKAPGDAPNARDLGARLVYREQTNDDPKNPPCIRTVDPSRDQDLAQLRGRAERKARALRSENISVQWPAEARHVMHELRVHQIELEMQNEELRATREQLEASWARYLYLYDLAPVGYCTLSTCGSVLEANLTAATLLGVARRELVKHPLSRFVFKEDQAVYYCYRKRLKPGEPQACELRMVKDDGGIFWARLEAATAGDEGGTPISRIVISDISEQKRAAEDRAAYAEMVRQKSLLDAVMESLPVGLALLDTQGGTMRANPEFERIWGGPPPVEAPFSNHAVYRGRWAASDQPVGPEDWASARALRNRETTVGQELLIQRFDGRQAFILNSAAPIRDANGKISGCSVAIMDITELKAIEKQFREAQKLEGLGVLAGGIAHDFNNLLGSILANSELAHQKLAGGCPADEEIRNIQNVAGRATEIVRQMMAYAGRETAALEPVDLSRLVGDMLQLLQISISKSVALKMDLKENLPGVLANPAQIRQVVMNLITNASEAIGESGGVITIATSEVQAAGGSSASVEGLWEGGGVRLEISDTGCGMTEEIQAKIFDPFFTTKFAGRGLGLAAVHGIIRDLGGTINVVSAPGRGTRFEILMPCAGRPARDAGDSPVAAVDESWSFAGTILLVEDEEALRSAVSKMLRRKGCTVIEAADGQAGIEHFRASAQEIELVLLDLTLPGKSGSEVMHELQRIQPNLKVILTSAYSRDWVQNTVGRSGPWLYLRKPYHFSQLTDLIRKTSIWTNPTISGEPG